MFVVINFWFPLNYFFMSNGKTVLSDSSHFQLSDRIISRIESSYKYIVNMLVTKVEKNTEYQVIDPIKGMLVLILKNCTNS